MRAGFASEADAPDGSSTIVHSARLAIVVDPSSAKAAFLAEVAAPATTCVSVTAALAEDTYGVVIADATEATLGALARDPGPLRAFTGCGGCHDQRRHLMQVKGTFRITFQDKPGAA